MYYGVNFFRPFLRRRAKRLRPEALLFRARKPTFLTLFLLLGWYVRLVAIKGEYNKTWVYFQFVGHFAVFVG